VVLSAGSLEMPTNNTGRTASGYDQTKKDVITLHDDSLSPVQSESGITMPYSLTAPKFDQASRIAINPLQLIGYYVRQIIILLVFLPKALQCQIPTVQGIEKGNNGDLNKGLLIARVSFPPFIPLYPSGCLHFEVNSMSLANS
jgi:hypothetical protein